MNSNPITSVVVAGSRGFNSYEILQKQLNVFLEGKFNYEIEIVSGGAKGADTLGIQFATNSNCFLKIMNADWGQYGRRAGYMRNEDMAKYGDWCIVFWDGVSRGSSHMIDLAKKYNMRLMVVIYKEEVEYINEVPNIKQHVVSTEIIEPT